MGYHKYMWIWMFSVLALAASPKALRFQSPQLKYSVEQTPEALKFRQSLLTLSVPVKKCNAALREEFWSDVQKNFTKLPHLKDPKGEAKNFIRIDGQKRLLMPGPFSLRVKNYFETLSQRFQLLIAESGKKCGFS
jgi:hypothetical protein